nr:nibrin [Quercus suber]
MWILSCDGELWGGRRRWLRPGSRHLLGRTHNREPGHRVESIDDKSVSRKHAIIAVANVNDLDSGKLHSRTEVTITDDSKIGTRINGQKVHKATTVLSDLKEYTIELGSYKHVFRLKWQPITLTLAHLSSKTKESGLADVRQLFGGSDVKLATEYVPEHTTHLVANKRNTVAALQALTQARWLVSPEFIDRLADAVASAGLDDNSEPIPSPLEIDFDVNRPNEMDLPAPSGSRELVKRPGSYLRPQPERAEVFQDYLFVFMSQTQYDTLIPAVTSGGGKAALMEVILHETEVGDFVDYVKELAGKKGSHQFKLSQQTQKGGVVVVRLGDKSNEWVVKFLTDVEITLDQRSIEQGEFLDAIMTVDASDLRRPLKDAESVAGSVSSQLSPPQVGPTRATRHSTDTGHSATPYEEQQAEADKQTLSPPPAGLAEPDPEPVQKKRSKRVTTQSRLKRFIEDDDDEDEMDSVQETKHSASSQPADEQNRENFTRKSVSKNMDDERLNEKTDGQSSHRKRSAPVELEREEDMFDNMLEGQAAMKRLKLTATTQHDDSTSRSHPESNVKESKTSLVAMKKSKQRNLIAELQMKREKEQEDRRKDEESLRIIADGVDVSKLRDVAKVEGMDLPVRQDSNHRDLEHRRSARWDPAWDGRKNFKKFRPQGQGQQRLGPKRVIVGLEEVPRKGHGIGEEYWQSISSHVSSGKSKTQSQSGTQVIRDSQAGSAPSNANEDLRFRRRLQRSREEDAEDSEIIPEEIAGTARDQDLQAKAYGTQSDTLVVDSQRGATAKRPAATQAGPAAKKVKQSTITSASRVRDRMPLDDDDDDGLKFRRKRR